jgi:hypothetical protein
VQAAAPLSREVLLLLAPTTVGGSVLPTRAEVVEALAALAEHPAQARPLLERGLPEAWWDGLNDLNNALRLNGVVWALPLSAEADAAGPAPEVLATVRRARLIVLGPGDPAISLLPAVQAQGLGPALREAAAPRVWAGPSGNGHSQLEAALGQPVPAAGATPARLQAALQAQLLHQAAGQPKTQQHLRPGKTKDQGGM